MWIWDVIIYIYLWGSVFDRFIYYVVLIHVLLKYYQKPLKLLIIISQYQYVILWFDFNFYRNLRLEIKDLFTTSI